MRGRLAPSLIVILSCCTTEQPQEAAYEPFPESQKQQASPADTQPASDTSTTAPSSTTDSTAADGLISGNNGNAGDLEDNSDNQATPGTPREERVVVQELVRANCVPRDLTSETCAPLYQEWSTIKKRNAGTNAAGRNQSLCDYYKSLVIKYQGIQRDFCNPPNGLVPAELAPLTISEYCWYGEYSLNHFLRMQGESC